MERYNRLYGKVGNIDHLSLFDESNQGMKEYRARLLGNKFEWLGNRPDAFRAIETQIHAQRSQHQSLRVGSAGTCQLVSTAEQNTPTDQPGLRLEIFNSVDINHALKPGIAGTGSHKMAMK